MGDHLSDEISVLDLENETRGVGYSEESRCWY